MVALAAWGHAGHALAAPPAPLARAIDRNADPQELLPEITHFFQGLDSTGLVLGQEGDRDFSPEPRPGDSLWIEGEVIRRLLSPSIGQSGAGFLPVLNGLQGLRLVRGTRSVEVLAYFDRARSVRLLRPGQPINSKQLYEMGFPKTLRLNVRLNEGVLDVRGRPYASQALRLGISLPYLPDSVYFQGVRADLTDGDAVVYGGVLGNTVVAAARVQLFDRKLTGFQLFQSALATYWSWAWPELIYWLGLR